MPAHDPHVLNAQLQRVLDTANKTLTADQAQLLEREIQSSMGSSVPGPSKKRKAFRCDGTNCGPSPSSSRHRIQAQEVEIPTELLAGKFRCEACSQWVALRDETGFTLAPWVAHLLACGQSKTVLARTKNILNDTRSTSHHGSPSQQSMALVTAPSSGIALENKPHSSLSTLEQYPFLHGRVVPLSDASSVPAESRGPPVPPTLPMAQDHTLFSVPRLAPNHNGPAHAAMHVDSLAASSTSGSLDIAPPKQRRPNRSEVERVAEFRADPHVAEVEPYRVLCGVCNKWIKLRKNSRYCSIPWDCHKTSCARANNIPNSAPKQTSITSSPNPQHAITSHVPNIAAQLPVPGDGSSAATNPSLAHLSLVTTQAQPNLLPPSAHRSVQSQAEKALPPSSSTCVDSSVIVTPTAPRTLRRPRLADAEQRRAALQSDPNTKVVESDRVLCRLCGKWVKLRPNSSFCAAPWQSHIQRCVAKKRRQGVLGVNYAPTPERATPALPQDTLESARGSSASGGNGEEPLQNLKAGEVTDRPTGNYYRKNYEEPCDLRLNDGKIKASYYKIPPPPALTSSAPLRRRRGRPPKNQTQALASNDTRAKSDDEMSYESEEE